MGKVKNTKTELKAQRDSLKRYRRYLPTLQLKKQQLQMEIRQVDQRVAEKKADRLMKQGIRLLGWRLILTDRGKVVRKVLPEKIRQEKRKLRKLRMKLDAGKLTIHQVREHYRSCKAHLLRGNTRQALAALDAYYTELFNEEAPTCKKQRKRKR